MKQQKRAIYLTSKLPIRTSAVSPQSDLSVMSEPSDPQSTKRDAQAPPTSQIEPHWNMNTCEESIQTGGQLARVRLSTDGLCIFKNMKGERGGNLVRNVFAFN